MRKSNFKSFALSALSILMVSACTATGTVTPVPSSTTGPTSTPMPTSEPTVAPTPNPSSSATVAPTPMPTPTAPVVTTRTVYALDANNTLYRFSSNVPSTINGTINVVGLQPLETLIGIDFRPVDKKLYGIGTTSRLYVIDTTTGNATQVAGPFSPLINGISFGFDFNPVADRVRVHSNLDQNLRINPVTGGVAATDPNIAYADNDSNAGANPNINGSAYTNNFSGATTTELYAIDSDRDILVKLLDANNGKLSTVGPLGVNTDDFVGFDIDANGIGYAALRVSGGASSFYRINLESGSTTLIENIGTNNPIRGIAIEN